MPIETVLGDPMLRARFTVHERIGRGGSGAVYRAQQLATGQTVALKIFDDHRRSKDSWARFVREARLCATLHHPHIVRIIDAHESALGLWSAFEWVPGRDLSAVLASEGRLAPSEAVRVMSQVLDALAAAHRRGIVHRDVKPANIMISATGVRRNASVLDFGVGTLVDELTALDQTHITTTGDFVGTPAYAAPEQLRGETPSERTDIYGWALTFLEAITGRRMVPGRSLSQVIARHLAPEPLAVPEALEHHPIAPLLSRALARDPAARDVTIVELLSALEALDADAVRRLAPHEPLEISGDVALADATLVDAGASVDTFETRVGRWSKVAADVQQLSVDDADFLGRVALLRQLDPAEAERMHGIMLRCRVPAGEVVADMGAAGLDAFVVREGVLALDMPVEGGEARIVARVGPGSVVGEACLIEPAPRTLRIRAESAVSLYVIDGERFALLCDGDDPGAHKVLRAITVTLCERLRHTNASLEAHLQGREAATEEHGIVEVPLGENGAWERLMRLFGRGR